MLAVLFLVGAALFGICIVRRLMRELLNGAEQILWGIVVGWTLTIIGVYLVALWQGQLTHSLMVATTIAVWIVSAILVAFELRRPTRAQSSFVWQRHYFGLALVMVLFTPVYWRLFSSHMFAPGEGGVYSGGGAFYDLSFHSALATSFLYGKNFPAIYPLLPPEPLLYPFLPDFQLSMLLGLGMSLRGALLLTSLALALATTGLFYSFALRVTRDQKPAALATILFLLNGGFGFVYFFIDWWKSGKSLVQFWNTLDVNYAAFPDRGLYWLNLINLFPAQRTFLFGVPIALLVFTIFAIVWQRLHEKSDSTIESKNLPSTRTLMLFAGAFTGVLPWFHTHTYIAVGLISGVLFLFRPRVHWIFFWAPAVLIALPNLIPLAQHASGGNVLRLLPAWLGHNESSIVGYLVRDFGLTFVLAVPAWFIAPWAWKKFYLAFLAVFILALIVNVSPSSFDNGKLLYYWNVFNSVIVAWLLIRFARRNWQRIAAGVVALMCVATGIMALQEENHRWARVFSDQDMAIADFVRANTAPRSLFLTGPVYDQPVLCLAGRAVLLAPPTWLWSHGYDFREREADVRRIYAGTSDAIELLRYYKVDYVYLSDAERKILNADQSFFDKSFAATYREGGVTIYDAHRSATGTIISNEPYAGALNHPAPRELAARLDRDPYPLFVEFPRTSFFVYRLVKATYGRMPRRDEFMTAMKEIDRGVFKERPGWKDQIEANRNSLLNSWTNNQAFKQFYDSKSNAELVNTILANTSVNWSDSKRNELIKSLDSNQMSRQAALLRIVEDGSFFKREYNTAYVLMNFFGYLRRNPDDPPDKDLSGLNFWRDNLDLWGDYPNISRAFVESIEYNNLKPAP